MILIMLLKKENIAQVFGLIAILIFRIVDLDKGFPPYLALDGIVGFPQRTFWFVSKLCHDSLHLLLRILLLLLRVGLQVVVVVLILVALLVRWIRVLVRSRGGVVLYQSHR